MTYLIKLFLINKFSAKLLLRPLLRLDQFIYFLIGQYSTLNNGGVHPKHKIIKYQEWFCENLDKNWSVLDVGSNAGLMSLIMSKSVKKVYGIEINHKLHQKALLIKKENLDFINADATQFDYSNIEQINCVTLSNVLEHIEDRVGFLTALINKINWVSQPYFLIRVPMINRHWVVILKKQMDIDYRLDPTHFIEFTEETFVEEVHASGLKVIDLNIRWGEIYAKVQIK